MKYTSIFFVGLLVILGCSNAQTSDKEPRLTISGKVENPQQQGVITLNEIQRSSVVPVDTIELNSDNTYSFKFYGEPGFYQLNFYGIQAVTVILENSNLTVNVDGSDPRGFYEVSGSMEIDQIKKYNADQAAEFGAKEQELNDKYVAAKQAGDEASASAVQQEYMDLLKDKEKLTIATIKEVGPNLVSFQLLSGLDKDRNVDFIDSMAQILNKKYPDKFFIQDLVDQMQIAKKTAVGKVAPEIALPTPEGNILKLSSLRGQVVLVDFWAQWCKPCRMENPNVVAAYKKYHDKGFTVYGVSLDRTKEKWVQAIEEDGLTWNQVSDLKYFNSEAAREYGVDAIPFSILLDRNGVVVAKNLRGAALDKELDKLFAAEGK
ncbi:MAG: AhpC/TSA family protein [Cyclobacteriaceae bacterium]|nr:AhpC/TSA family protein [Cyclobacteriaceae bacterium]